MLFVCFQQGIGECCVDWRPSHYGVLIGGDSVIVQNKSNRYSRRLEKLLAPSSLKHQRKMQVFHQFAAMAELSRDGTACSPSDNFSSFQRNLCTLAHLKQLVCNNSASREPSEKWLSQSAEIRIRQKNIYTIHFKCYNNNKSQCCVYVCTRWALFSIFFVAPKFKSEHSNNGVRVYITFSIPIKYSFGVFWGVFNTCFLAFRFFLSLQPFSLSLCFALLTSVHMTFALQWGCALKSHFFFYSSTKW